MTPYKTINPDGTRSWQYLCWVNVMTPIKQLGFVAKTAEGKIMPNGIFVSNTILDYQLFYPFITNHRLVNLIDGARLEINPFRDREITAKNLWYLPRSISKNLEQWFDYRSIQLDHFGKQYYSRQKGFKGTSTELGPCETADEIYGVYRQLKQDILKRELEKYEHQLDREFCRRLQERVLNHVV